MKDPKDITVNGEQLDKILARHKDFVLGNGGQRADLRYAYLRGAKNVEAVVAYTHYPNGSI